MGSQIGSDFERPEAALGTVARVRARCAGDEEFYRPKLPRVEVVGPGVGRRPTRNAILSRVFYIGGMSTRLATPIDWIQDPHESRTWCYELHNLTWLEPALDRYERGRDTDALVVARDVMLDWVRAHPGDEGQAGEAEESEHGEVSPFAWYDMAVGLRAPYIAYVLCACLAEDLIAEADADLLIRSATRHGRELARIENYIRLNNHGLFQDEGLYLLARQLPELPQSEDWASLALVRMRDTLERTICWQEGGHLEHSPAYQLAMVELVARLEANVEEWGDLGELLGRLRRTAAWQVTPLGKLVQLGDTDDLPAPAWARDSGDHLEGLNPLFETGQAFVREGKSYLAVSAAYHGATHKHADDTGFTLVENGFVIAGDPGRWGYYEDEPDRLYARSAAAHNVLTVDGCDFGWKDAAPYGSGLQAAGTGEGWTAILASNPLLADQGVTHRRLFLYRPGEVLLVLDDVRSEASRSYVRHFHLGPRLTAEADGDRVLLEGPRVRGSLRDPTGDTSTELIAGRDLPVRLGWTYPGDRERAEVTTVVMNTSGTDLTLAASLSLQPEDERFAITSAALDADSATLEFAGSESLVVAIEGRSAQIFKPRA